MTSKPLLTGRNLRIDTPSGRPLFRGLGLSLSTRDRVAIVGRNGVGKSTLLEVLSGAALPDGGTLTCTARRQLVRQRLPTDGRVMGSPGQRRRDLLEAAFEARPALLLLDEPTQDLDAHAARWLLGALRRHAGGLVVVSHDRRLLERFGDFVIVSETGCRHFTGSFDGLQAELASEEEASERRYQRHLARLERAEARSAADRQRRTRKKHLGRVREIGRCPARALLNHKRSYAQEKQAKRRLLRQARIEDKRQRALAARRTLPVHLALEAVIPVMPPSSRTPIVSATGVGAAVAGRTLFSHIDICLSRQRLAITGPNGAGKSTLADILAGQRRPTHGHVRCDPGRIGHVAQQGDNWRSPLSVLDHLATPGDATALSTAEAILGAHRFPLALSRRPLASLSPGERLRAALVCLCHRRPTPELLVLDEPAEHLDLQGQAALEAFLEAWPGALVLVSHDEGFLGRLRIDERLALAGTVAPRSPTPDGPVRD